jgi:hypothetical protein
MTFCSNSLRAGSLTGGKRVDIETKVAKGEMEYGTEGIHE